MRILATFLVGCASLTSYCYAAENPEKAPVAPHERTLKERVSEPRVLQIWEGYLRADTHVRYHQALAERYGRWALASKIFLSVFSVFVLAFGLIHYDYLKKHTWAKWFGALSLSASIAFGYIPFSEWRNTHYVLSQRWNGLFNEWKNLRADLPDLDPDSLTTQTTALLARERAIEESEPPSTSEALYEKCEDETDRALGIGKYQDSA